MALSCAWAERILICIRELGDYEILIQLHAEVMTTVNISVVAE